MSYLLPILSSSPIHSSVGENFSWITIKNDVPRELYAQAVYSINHANSYSNVNNYSIKTDVGTVLSANPIRKSLYCRNMALSGDPLYVKYGDGASETSFSVVLKASFDYLTDGEGNPLGYTDGCGEILSDEQVYQGVVSVSGVNARYMLWEGY